jgi:hypothetical protein
MEYFLSYTTGTGLFHAGKTVRHIEKLISSEIPTFLKLSFPAKGDYTRLTRGLHWMPYVPDVPMQRQLLDEVRQEILDKDEEALLDDKIAPHLVPVDPFFVKGVSCMLKPSHNVFGKDLDARGFPSWTRTMQWTG